MGVGLRTVAVLLILATTDGPARGLELPDGAGSVAYVAGDARNAQRITGEDA